jgi:hypothetical protein
MWLTVLAGFTMTVAGRRVDERVDGDRTRTRILVADERLAMPHWVPPHTDIAMTVSPTSDGSAPSHLRCFAIELRLMNVKVCSTFEPVRLENPTLPEWPPFSSTGT